MSMTLTAISIDRLLAVSKPLFYRRMNIRWTYVAITACGVAGFFKNWLLKSLKFYKMLMPFHMVSFSAFFIIYALILYKIRSRLSLGTVANVNQSMTLQEIRATKTVFYVVLTYVLFVMPFFVSELTSPFADSSKKMRYLGRFLLLCNSTVNPFIYFFRITHARKNIMAMFGFKSESSGENS